MFRWEIIRKLFVLHPSRHNVFSESFDIGLGYAFTEFELPFAIYFLGGYGFG